MVNHMGQGATKSMENSTFLAQTLSRVAVSGDLTLAQAIHVYGSERMPKAHMKQQVSFLNGAIWQLPDRPEQRARDAAMPPELRGEPMVRSSNLYGDPYTTLSIYAYDAEKHAERSIKEYLDKQG